MTLHRKKIFSIIIIFLLSILLTGISIVIGIGLVGLPENASNLSVFLTISLLTFYSLSKTEGILGSKYTLLIIILAWFVLFLPKALNSSFIFTLTNIPFFISFLMGAGAGFLFYKNRSLTGVIALGVFPFLLAIGLGSYWGNKIIYGTVSGEVEAYEAPDFSVVDREGGVSTNESFKGKIVLLDFWFIKCPPCWVKFPKLQMMFEKYLGNEKIRIYAVNHPMKRDRPQELFNSIEEKGYTFPVVKGSDDMITDFGITYYPTIIIIDTDGKIVYRGTIENAEVMVERLLKTM